MQLVYSLQQHSSGYLELMTILMLFCVDQSHDLCSFYLVSRNVILAHFQEASSTISSNKTVLDELQVRLDDWASISGRVFNCSRSSEVVMQLTALVSVDLARGIGVSNAGQNGGLLASRLQQILLKVHLDRRQALLSGSSEDIKYSRRLGTERKNEVAFGGMLRGFLKWGPPLVTEAEILMNPKMKESIQKAIEFRRERPLMPKRLSTPEQRGRTDGKVDGGTNPMPVRPREGKRKLKSEIRNALKEASRRRLKFSLEAYYYQRVDDNNAWKFQQLEEKHERAKSAEQLLNRSGGHDDEEEERQLFGDLVVMKMDVEQTERQLRKEGLLRPTLRDQFISAGRTTFREPGQGRRNRTGAAARCLHNYEVRKDDQFGNYMVMAFRATYFDRTITELPPPLAYDISTNQVHRLFSETSGARGFQPVQFEAISYFESADERMLRLAEGDKLTAAAQLNDFLVGCNQKNEIGCFAPGYARQVRESLLN